MIIKEKALAGTMESSDCLVYVEPAAELKVEVASVVMVQFGTAIEKAVLATLSTLNVKNGYIKVQDRGALDCVIQAIVETAVRRSEKGVQNA